MKIRNAYDLLTVNGVGPMAKGDQDQMIQLEGQGVFEYRMSYNGEMLPCIKSTATNLEIKNTIEESPYIIEVAVEKRFRRDVTVLLIRFVTPKAPLPLLLVGTGQEGNCNKGKDEVEVQVFNGGCTSLFQDKTEVPTNVFLTISSNLGHLVESLNQRQQTSALFTRERYRLQGTIFPSPYRV